MSSTTESPARRARLPLPAFAGPGLAFVRPVERLRAGCLDAYIAYMLIAITAVLAVVTALA